MVFGKDTRRMLLTNAVEGLQCFLQLVSVMVDATYNGCPNLEQSVIEKVIAMQEHLIKKVSERPGGWLSPQVSRLNYHLVCRPMARLYCRKFCCTISWLILEGESMSIYSSNPEWSGAERKRLQSHSSWRKYLAASCEIWPGGHSKSRTSLAPPLLWRNTY